MKKRKPKQAKKRCSVEERLDTMSSTLMAMKDLLVQNGIVIPSDRCTPTTSSGKKKAVGSGKNTSNQSGSETTIYQNALDKIETRSEIVDSEITFKVKENQALQPADCPVDNKRDSSSSEERIDTSDELMDVNLAIDLNEKFIADCAQEAENSRKRSYPEEARPTAREQAEDKIRQAEASKICMLTTPGKDRFNVFESRFNGGTAMQHSSLVDENYVIVGRISMRTFKIGLGGESMWTSASYFPKRDYITVMSKG